MFINIIRIKSVGELTMLNSKKGQGLPLNTIIIAIIVIVVMVVVILIFVAGVRPIPEAGNNCYIQGGTCVAKDACTKLPGGMGQMNCDAEEVCCPAIET